MNRGKFVVLYGANNLGKTTQLAKLADFSRAYLEHETVAMKYAIYSSPVGKLIDDILRGRMGEDFEISDEEFQLLFSMDRRDFQPNLMAMLDRGVDVFAEDYVGTSLAWGITKGVSKEKLIEFNRGLLVPDLSIVLDGERFTGGIEKGHRHEGAGEKVWELNREIHRELAAEFDWKIVDASGNVEQVHNRIKEVYMRELGYG